LTTALIAVAGAAGAVLRYRLGMAIGVRSFPWATLFVNLSGSFVLAAVLGGPAQARWSPTVVATVAIGFLGAYTTFSTFGYETFTLLRTGRVGSAAAYATASLVGGVAVAGAGYALGRALV
jgi:CrcB protein